MGIPSLDGNLITINNMDKDQKIKDLIEQNGKLQDNIDRARHLMTMLTEKINEIDEAYYTSSDLILFSDDWDKVVAGECDDAKHEADYLGGIDEFIQHNSNMNLYP